MLQWKPLQAQPLSQATSTHLLPATPVTTGKNHPVILSVQESDPTHCNSAAGATSATGAAIPDFHHLLQQIQKEGLPGKKKKRILP